MEVNSIGRADNNVSVQVIEGRRDVVRIQCDIRRRHHQSRGSRVRASEEAWEFRTSQRIHIAAFLMKPDTGPSLRRALKSVEGSSGNAARLLRSSTSREFDVVHT